MTENKNIFKLSIISDFLFEIYRRIDEILINASIDELNHTLVYIKERGDLLKGKTIDKNGIDWLNTVFNDPSVLKNTKANGCINAKNLISKIENLESLCLETSFSVFNKRSFEFSVIVDFQQSTYNISILNSKYDFGNLPTESEISYIIEAFTLKLNKYLSR